MKNFILIIAIVFCFLSSKAQSEINISEEFPTKFEKSFTFPLGSKILIELKETKEGKFEYSVLSIKKIEEYYSFKEGKKLFDENPKENTVEIFFMGAYANDGEKDEDWNTLLKLRNNLKKPINYKADIKYYYKDEFENTSIVGAFPGTDTNETWRHKIDFVTLYDFEIKNYK